MTFWYLATPYENYPKGKMQACTDAAMQAARLVELGVPLFCPIAHAHLISLHCWGISDPHRFWLDFDRPFMAAAKGLIVCQLEGWQESKGIKEEIEFFQAEKKPVIMFDPALATQDLLNFLEFSLNTRPIDEPGYGKLKNKSDAGVLVEWSYWHSKLTKRLDWGAAAGAAVEFLRDAEGELRRRGIEVPK